MGIFTADITTGMIGFLISTFGVTIIGEIIPQAICQRYALAVGANTLFILKFYMVVLFPVAWPLSKLVECMLGKERPTYMSIL